MIYSKETTPSFEKKRPDGPSSGNNASFTGHSAPSSSILKKNLKLFLHKNEETSELATLCKN
jgi:hypothetical protein